MLWSEKIKSGSISVFEVPSHAGSPIALQPGAISSHHSCLISIEFCVNVRNLIDTNHWLVENTTLKRGVHLLSPEAKFESVDFQPLLSRLNNGWAAVGNLSQGHGLPRAPTVVTVHGLNLSRAIIKF